MGNCNTLTCSLDGKITPQDAPGAGDAAPARAARACPSIDRTGRRAPPPRASIPQEPRGTVGIPQQPDPGFMLRDPLAVPRRPQAQPRQPGSTTVTIRQPPPPPSVGVGTGTALPDRPQAILTQPEQPTQLFRLVDPMFPGNNVVIGDGGVDVARFTDRKPTDLGGGAADTPAEGNVGGFGPLTHVEGVQPGVKAPAPDVTTEGMVLGDATPASGTTKSAGALDVRRCYERFMGLTPPAQARVLTTGILGRYQLAQLAARDIANGVPGAAVTAANWLFNTFPLEAAEQIVFCNAVHYTAPGGLLVNMRPDVAPANIAPAAQQGIDQWSMAGRTAAVDARRQWMRGASYLPAGAIAPSLDYAGALNLFRSLETAQQVATLGSLAFEGDAYAQALAQGLAQGYPTLDGVPIVDLATAHISLIPVGDPRWVLFAFAAQNATAPAGDLWGDLTNALGFGASTPTASTGRNVTAPSSTTRPTSTTTRPTSTTTRPASTTTTRPTPAQAAAEAAQAQAMTVSSEFLQAAGLTSSQWAQLSRERPEMASQLFREFQNRPNTFAQVAATVLQAAQAFLLGLHQQNVDDLAAANANYQHQQAMAQAAIQREQTDLQRAQLALQQQQLQQQSQMVMTPSAIVAQPAEPPAQQPPAEGMSYGAKVGIAGAVAAVIGLGYVATTRKRNGRAKAARRRTRRAA